MWPQFLPELESRFLRYVQVDTQSDESVDSVPSTPRQFVLLRQLTRELQALGALDVVLTPQGHVLATVPATASDAPTIAFFAHVDTSPDFSGKDVRPLVHRDFDGTPIVLPDDPRQVLTPRNSPELFDKHGEDIVTASGTTLLGADDKAGIAIIMTLVGHLLAHPEIPRGRLRICFNSDEEIGRGVAHLDLADLGADVGYTLDGSALGEITYETFSADRAIVVVEGVAAHPGYAKGRLVNALQLAAQLILDLARTGPTPETTAGRDGFLHAYHLEGNAARAEIHFILRDFELDGLTAHQARLRDACAALEAAAPEARVTVSATPQYRNMRYWLENDMRPVELAIAAIEDAGIEPVMRPIRGGTDGARLTEMGLPSPNIFTGMHNFHGPLEWISLQDMARATEVCVHLVRRWADARTGSPPGEKEQHHGTLPAG